MRWMRAGIVNVWLALSLYHLQGRWPGARQGLRAQLIVKDLHVGRIYSLRLFRQDVGICEREISRKRHKMSIVYVGPRTLIQAFAVTGVVCHIETSASVREVSLVQFRIHSAPHRALLLSLLGEHRFDGLKIAH